MTSNNSPIEGDATDLGATLDDIQRYLIKSRDETEASIKVLAEYRDEVNDNCERIRAPDDVSFYIECIIEELQKFLKVFERLIAEVPRSVEPRHPKLVRDAANWSRELDLLCMEFKRQHTEDRVKDESMRWLLDKVYKESRSQIRTYRNLRGLDEQLETYVGSTNYNLPLSIDDIDSLELKPNFMGIGINLNHLIKRLIHRWKRRSSR
jgi:hypothetical protein